MDSLETRLKEQARKIGFDLVGIAPAVAADHFDRLEEWLARGFAGEMGYMEKHAQARRHPSSILPTVRSVIMVALNYAASAPASPGRISRYARGEDYHDVLRRKLNGLLAWIQEQVPRTQGRGVIDTAPLLERDFARRAGLGWFGKNTMLLHKKLGSWFFLGALLVDLELAADAPFATQHCGTCTACLDACPTQAFVGPGMLDARRCISYLTIELRGLVPEDLRPGLGDWIFGCDVCQEVCPWNRKAPLGQEPAFQSRPELEKVDLLELLLLSEEEFRRRFRHTALWRTKRRGLVRNVALVLGNTGDERALPGLRKVMHDPDPVIREAAAWAVEQIESRTGL
jgi:epoxyqueuosine reductase